MGFKVPGIRSNKIYGDKYVNCQQGNFCRNLVVGLYSRLKGENGSFSKNNL